MKSLINKVLATTTLMSVGGAIFTINPVSAANIGYDLKFFNNLGSQVGSGGFSYNPDTSTCIPDSPVDDFCEFGGFFVNTELTDFSANISGTEWQLNDRNGQFWWDEDLSTVQGLFAPGGNLSVNPQWLFGDPVFDAIFLDMIALEQTGRSWRQQLSFNNVLEGTWTAELRDTTSPGGHVIPEPLTILGAGVAIGFGAFFKRKLQ